MWEGGRIRPVIVIIIAISLLLLLLVIVIVIVIDQKWRESTLGEAPPLPQPENI